MALHRALDCPNEHIGEEGTGLIRVAGIIEFLGSIFAGAMQEDVITPWVLIKEFSNIVHFSADEKVAALIGLVLLELSHGEDLGHCRDM